MKKKKEHERMKEIYELTEKVLGETVAYRARLDANEESEAKDMDIIERMKFIASKTESATEEMEAMLPEDYRIYSEDVKKETLRILQWSLSEGSMQEYMCRMECFIDGCEEDQLEEFESHKHLYLKEFHDAQMAYLFMQDILTLMKILIMGCFEDPLQIMNKLLKLTEATLNELARFWRRWKSNAVMMEEKIVVSNIIKVDKVYLCVLERILQEVIALNFLSDFKGNHETMNMVVKKNGFYEKTVINNYWIFLYEMEYDCILSSSPIEEPISWFFNKLHRDDRRIYYNI